MLTFECLVGWTNSLVDRTPISRFACGVCSKAHVHGRFESCRADRFVKLPEGGLSGPNALQIVGSSHGVLPTWLLEQVRAAAADQDAPDAQALQQRFREAVVLS